MKSTIITKATLTLGSAAFLAATSASEAALTIINVDIQGSGSGGAAFVANYTGASANGPITSGTTWNHFTVGPNPPNGDFLLDLVDHNGAPTTVDVTFGTGWLGSYADGSPNNLQGDRVFTATGVTGDITIGGLTPGGTYNIALITARNAAGAFGTNFTIGATTLTAVDTVGAGTNANGPLTFTEGGTHVLFSNILADGSGNITFTMTNKSGAANGVLAGLQIQGVPEPSAVALIGLAGLGLLLRRRR